KGIESISDKYIALAYSAIKSNDTQRARTYISKAEEIWPESTKINTANQTLQAKIDENAQQSPAEEPVAEPSSQEQPQQTAETGKGSEDESTGLVGGVKKWFKESAEKNKDVKKEETASDKLIKSMGGGE
ncbi:MAG: hypothetical protein HY356_01270, partial [Gammaproteobacteria bacterium]|nr:hypothetical protein [Gammaproteobacteria bacterium]